MLRWTALTVALALLATACGSTVQTTGTGPGQDGAVAVGEGGESGEEEMELGAPSATEGSTTQRQEQSGGQATAATETQGEAETGNTAEADAPDDGSDQDDAASSTAAVRGVDDDQIRVGLGYAEDGGEANEAIGASGITQGDPQRNYEALLDYFNAQGGIAGREIVPVYHQYEGTSPQGAGSQEQAACATYTEDNEVFVVLERGLNLTDGTLLSCLENTGTPALGSPGASVFDDAVYERFQNFGETNTLSLDTIADLWPDAMADTDYFEPRGPASPVRVGLVTYDGERMQGVTERSLRPAMRAVGEEFVEEAYIGEPDRLSDVGGMSTEINNAILRFRSEGIEHVMIQDYGNALLTLLFMTAAENQSYRPRYGLNSNNGGQVLVGTVPPAQFSEARLVGWNPMFDVPEGEADESMGRSREVCEEIYEEAGITFPDLNARAVSYLHCDQFLSLIAAVDEISGPLTQDALVPAFAELGTTYESALSGPTRLAPDRRYGVARARLAEFSDDCDCFRYSSDWRDVP